MRMANRGADTKGRAGFPEPTLPRLSHPFLRYFLATRPAFLSVTLFAWAVGIAAAFGSGLSLSLGLAAVTLVFALVAHAGVNVLNDYYDGTDAINTERLFPYTGGSRFIQNGVLSARQTARFGAFLMGTVIAAGSTVAWVSGPGLWAIGVAGLFIGWAYSAPPFKLNSRGLGELCVAAGFGLIVVGTDYVQRGAFGAAPAVAAVSYALLVTNVLYINQFPDRSADAAVGKRHWVVRLSPARARWIYGLIGLGAYLWLAEAVVAGLLPPATLLGLAAAPLTALAGRDLLRHAYEPGRLRLAIERTIAAASLHGALLATGLVLGRILG
jgi:1,4-dihydroxy-2-naphthoate octaprenyltransferase